MAGDTHGCYFSEATEVGVVSKYFVRKPRRNKGYFGDGRVLDAPGRDECLDVRLRVFPVVASVPVVVVLRQRLFVIIHKIKEKYQSGV